MPVECRRHDHVVIERPQCGIGEALVVLLDLPGGQPDRVQLKAVADNRLQLSIGYAVPADPGSFAPPQDGRERGDQPGGTLLPAFGAIRDLLQDHR